MKAGGGDMSVNKDRSFAALAFDVIWPAIAMIVLTFISGRFAREFGHTAAVWAGNAFIIVVLLRTEGRRWPVIISAALFGMAAGLLLKGAQLAHILVLPPCNVADIMMCAAGMRWLLGRDIDLTSGRPLVVFLLLGGLIAPAISGAPVAWVMSQEQHSSFFEPFFDSFCSKALGVLVLTPVLLAISPSSLISLVGKGRLWRTVGLFGLLAATLAMVFLQDRFPLLFLVVPVLMLITFQLELIGGALAILITSLVSIWLSVAGHGPAMLVRGGLTDRLLLVQLFLAATTMSVLAVAAILARMRRSLVETEAARASAVESQRLAEMAEDIAGVGHWRLDARTGVLTWSEQIYQIYGLSSADGAPSLEQALEAFHPDDRDLAAAHVEAARRLGKSYAFNLRLIRPDGEVRHVLCRGVAEIGAGGEVRAVLAVFMDMTEAKRTEQVLRESEERFRHLADKSNDIIIQLDNSEIRFISPACLTVLGYRPDELIGKNIGDLMNPDDRVEVRAAFARHRAAGPNAHAVGLQFRCRHKDGHWVWIEGQPKIHFDAEGEIASVQDVLRDISERKAAEIELARAKQAAEAAAVAKSDFLANMSHEIRTPLTAIIGFSGLLEKIDTLPDDARRYVQRIVTGGRSLLAVVNDILDFSKLEANQVELDPQIFEPSAFVEDAVQLVAAQAANKGLELRFELDPELPAQVEADSSRLRQVLLNLLSNAVKFTDKGAVTVAVSYLQAQSQLLVEVIDTGCGIPVDKLDRLFARFSQVDGSVTRRHGGTGLGLAICKNLVELMGGEIGVRTVEGKGSTFRFTIAAPVRENSAALEAAASDGEEGASYKSAHILVVDDLPENRELARCLLEAIGHTVQEAGGGAEAVQAAIDSAFDLILMDLQMPGMDGLTATRAIRETAQMNAMTPILALSANVLAGQIAQCHAAGMNDHIAKPIKIDELISKVTRWINLDEPELDEPDCADELERKVQ